MTLVKSPIMSPEEARLAASVRDYVPPRILLLFDARALFDAADLKVAEVTAWLEALEPFGYTDLDTQQYIENLCQVSEEEVMQNFLQYTMREQWTTGLNKRRVRLGREVDDWCYANCVPISGARNFIQNCEAAATAEATTAAAALAPAAAAAAAAAPATATAARAPKNACAVWFTPLNEDVMLRALRTANLAPGVVPYTHGRSDFALLEVCDAFRLLPPILPPRLAEQWHRYRCQTLGLDPYSTSMVMVPGGVEGASPVSRTAPDVPPYTTIGTAPWQTQVVVLASSVRIAQQARQLGLPAVGVMYNNVDQDDDVEDERARIVMEGCPTAEDLLAAGCRVVLPDLTSLRPEFFSFLCRQEVAACTSFPEPLEETGAAARSATMAAAPVSDSTATTE